MEQTFKYKLDFYYQQALIYLITLIAYAGLRGSIIEDSFNLVFRDPILYIIIFFVFLSFVVLILNIIRNKRLTITDDAIIFRNRFHERKLNLSELEWIYIGRDHSVQTAGRSKVILLKLKNKKKLYRIRIGRYEHQKELIELIKDISKKVPQKKLRFQKFEETE